MSDINISDLTPYDKRLAMLPLHHDIRKIAIDNEFVVDYKYGRFFFNKNGTLQELSRDEIINGINESINNLINIDVNSVDFPSLVNNIDIINGWVNKHTTPIDPNIISTFDQLHYFLSGMDKFDFSINDLLESKVNMVEGKSLSDNNLRDEDVLKLDTIELNAKSYIHPDEYQCNINKGVSRLNGYPDAGQARDITLSLADIGLGNVEAGANSYKHPKEKQCDEFMIESLNDMTGDVIIDKDTLRLQYMKNMPLSKDKDFKSNNSYATPAVLENYLNSLEDERNLKGTDAYIFENIVIVIKKSDTDQYNEIIYTKDGIDIKTSIDIHIDDLYALNRGSDIVILSNNKIYLYRYSGDKYIETDIFTDIHGYNGNLVSSNTIKRIIGFKDGVYGLILTDSSGKDFIHIWGNINITTDPYKHSVEKVEISNGVIYILMCTGKVEYIEYGSSIINRDYRYSILSYNDIIDIFVLLDYMILVRGNRSLIVVGEDSLLNHGIPSKLKSITTPAYKIYGNDSTLSILLSDDSIKILGKDECNINSMKFQYPIEHVKIYKNRAILIDTKGNIIKIL